MKAQSVQNPRGFGDFKRLAFKLVYKRYTKRYGQVPLNYCLIRSDMGLARWPGTAFAACVRMDARSGNADILFGGHAFRVGGRRIAEAKDRIDGHHAPGRTGR